MRIVEKHDSGMSDDIRRLGIVRPNALYINGEAVMGPDSHPVTVERITVDGHEAAMVTCTLFVRSLTIEASDE